MTLHRITLTIESYFQGLITPNHQNKNGGEAAGSASAATAGNGSSGASDKKPSSQKESSGKDTSSKGKTDSEAGEKAGKTSSDEKNKS